MAEKVVSVKLTANVDGAVAGFRKVKASVDDLTKTTAPKSGDAFSKLSDKAALAGVGIAGAMGLAVKRFADFDQSMSAVAANSGATGRELENLRGLAIKLGADSQFSAKEAADGINEMAKAGVAAQDIMGGGLKGALDLAAAGQIGVAEAAETAATAMTQFKMQGDAVPHIADLLANAANKAQGGVGDMAQALKQSGLVAASTGLTIEETTAGLTAFASAGLIGSDAGTSFKTMLQRLSAPADQAKAQMDELGISAYDSQGNFVGLANVAGQLQSAMSDLTPAQRNAAMATIFGSDAIRAANVLYEQGAQGIQNWTDAVSEQGAAAKQAATLTDNLKGDIERLGGALDSVFIQTGGSANSGLRTLVQGLTGFVDRVGQIPGPLLLAGGALASFALLAPKGIKSYREYKAQLDALGISLDKITTKAPRTGAALEKAGVAAKRAAVAFVAASVAAGAFDEVFGKDGSGLGPERLTSDLTKSGDAVKAFSATVQKYAEGQSNWWNTDNVRSYGDVIKAVFDPSVGQRIDGFAGSVFGMSTDLSNGRDRLRELDQVLSGLVSSGRGADASKMFTQFAQAANESGVSTDQLKSKLPGYMEAMAAAANQTGVAGRSVDTLGKVMGGASDAMAAAAAEGDSVASALLVVGSNADAASDEVKNLAKTIQSDMDAASKAFQSSFDVLANYDPEKAASEAEAAAAGVASAEQRAADVRQRIAAKEKRTVADQQAQRRADDALEKARAKEKEANARLQSNGLKAMYSDTLAKARQFTADINEATKRGLDPQTVAKLLQEGPERAAPALKALLGENSKSLIKMSNDAEVELRKLNGVVVEQARLTAMAVNSTTDHMGFDLSTAMAIAAEKARLGGTATGEQIAKGIGASLPEIQRIAAEFGIALKIPSPTPPKLTVDNSDALARIRDTKAELANLDGARAITYIETRTANERDRRQDAANSRTTGTNLDLFNSPVRRAQGGIIPGYSPTATADNITMRATAGEYVLRKAAVDSIGKATLDYLNRHGRMPAYATGGLVGARAQAVPMMLAPSRSSTPDGLGRQFVTGSLDMGNGLQGFIRAIVADEVSGRKRIDALGAM